MIPVLGVPYLTRSDLFLDLIHSINHPVNDIVVIDNSSDGSCPQVDGSRTIKAHRNMGVSWAWNTIIQATPSAAWWCIVNSDVAFGDSDLLNLEADMAVHDLVLLESMSAFGISRNCVQTVGWFDEGFVPAYCEDNDYVYRARLLGIEPHFMASKKKHFGSASLKSDERFRNQNSRTYPANVARYKEKWGGIMHQEVFKTPYDKGGSPRDCPTLDIDRLSALSWD